jgi:hypothetical protein
VAATLSAAVLVSCGGGLAPSAASHQVFFGLDVPDPSASDIATAAGLVHAFPTVVSVFAKLDTPSLAQALSAAAPVGVTPMITLEPWLTGMKRYPGPQPDFSLTSLSSGRHDAALTAIAHQIKLYGRSVYLRFAHEMNGTWYPWAESVNGNRPGQYRAAWRHVHDLFAPITGGQIRWVWSPNSLTSLPLTAPSLAELYPGNSYVDFLGLTAYEHHSSRPSDTLANTISGLSRLSRKPILLAETGVTGPGKQTWLRNLGGYLESQHQVAGFVYFDTSPGGGATGDYNVDDSADAAALAASLRVIDARPYP